MFSMANYSCHDETEERLRPQYAWQIIRNPRRSHPLSHSQSFSFVSARSQQGEEIKRAWLLMEQRLMNKSMCWLIFVGLQHMVLVAAW